MRVARVLHDGRNVGKVEVDDHVLRVCNQLGDGADSLLQNVVRDTEGVGKGDLLVRDKFQAVVRDDDQGVYLIGKVRNAALCLPHTVRAFKLERLRHNADRQNALVVRQLRDDRSRARSRAAAHTGGDEDHVGILQHLRDSVFGFFGRLLADFGLRASAHAAGQLFADLDLVLAGRLVQILLIGIDCDKLNALYAGRNHSVDNVIAGAADADDFNLNNLFC